MKGFMMHKSVLSIMLFSAFAIIGCNESIKTKNQKSEITNSKIFQEISVECAKDHNNKINRLAICTIPKGDVYDAVIKKLECDPIAKQKFVIKVFVTYWKDWPKVNFQLPINFCITHVKGKLTRCDAYEEQFVRTGAQKGKLNYWTIVTINTVSPKTFKKASVRLLFKFTCKLKKPYKDYIGPYEIENPKCIVELLQN